MNKLFYDSSKYNFSHLNIFTCPIQCFSQYQGHQGKRNVPHERLAYILRLACCRGLWKLSFNAIRTGLRSIVVHCNRDTLHFTFSQNRTFIADSHVLYKLS